MRRQWQRRRSPSLLLLPRIVRLQLGARSLTSIPTESTDPSTSESKQQHKHTDAGDSDSDRLHPLITALKTFHKAQGHFVVPPYLVIPRAGQVVVNGRVVAAGASIQEAKYGVRTGDVFGPVSDVTAIAWTEDVRGMPFGQYLRSFVAIPMNRVNEPEAFQALREMGFPVDEDWDQYLWRQQILAPLKVFHKKKGHSMIPRSFEVPRHDPEWPVAAGGLRLGIQVETLRVKQRKDLLPQWMLDDLESVDFTDNVFETRWSTKVLPALQVFHQVKGHCNVQQKFVVPEEAPWPRLARGLRLGETVSIIRSRDAFASQVERDKQLLESINFVWDPSEYEWGQRILPSLQTFYQVFDHCDVPQDFTVPSSEPWPEAAWDLKLGFAVSNIRSQGQYGTQTTRDAAELKAINFVWVSRQERWDTVILPALQAYFAVYGNCCVPTLFIVPSEEPWPKQTWGVKLGYVRMKIMKNGSYHAQRLQDREALEAIQFGE